MFREGTTAAPMLDVRQLKGWLPVDAVVQDGRPGLLWTDMQGVSLDAPFFADAVARRTQELPQRSELFTDLDALLQFEKANGAVSPTGLIFHSSRCGSTAIANALKTLEGALVVSEPYVVDKLIGRLFTDARENHTKELLYSVLIRAAVSALGQHGGNAKSYFLKFSATSGLQLTRLRRIWPNVPWAFVYRDPLEIMVSNFRNAPVWLNHRADARMAAALSNVEEGEVRNISTEEFCARVLGRLFASASDNVTENARLLNHSELAVQTIVELAQFFGVSAADADRQRIEESLKVYSKDKTAPRLFAADSTEKRNAASAAMIVAVSRWAQGPYQQLEKRRTGEC